jgi:hypothetical protein
MYIFTCYKLMKSFHEKLTCRVVCVKKKKSSAKNTVFHKINFLFFFLVNHKILVFVKLDKYTYIMQMYM